MKKLGHIVNPVVVGENSDLFVAQPVTFRTMFAAKRFAIDEVDVDLMVIGYREDESIFPQRFKSLPPLTRSVLDVGNFKKQRKLPLIQDILNSAINQSDADYFIYSNVDISPMPFFYSAIADELKHHDALVINRRTIGKCESGRQPLAQYYQQVGEIHPGFDCFVFSRKQFENFKLFEACIGANWIGRVLICNLLAFADNPKIIKDGHLTFHLGDDRSWKTSENIDFDEHNESQVGKLMEHLNQLDLCNKHPLLEQSYQEFHLKTLDPDSTRPKRQQEETVKEPGATMEQTENTIPDFSVLPRNHRYSSSWDQQTDLALRQDPVFVVGHPRSGTTLLQSLIATQLTPAIFPETHFFSIVRMYIKVVDDIVQNESISKALSFLDDKLEMSSECRQYIVELSEQNELSPKMMFEALVFDQLSKRLTVDQIKKIRWMEKTPDHAEHLEVINRFYPNAKFIFVVRDPERAILSRRKHFTWNDEANWPIDRHIDRWTETIDSVDRFMDSHPNQVHCLQFENVIADKVNAISGVCRFLAIPFASELLDNYPRFSRQQNLEWEEWKTTTEQGISQSIADGRPESLNPQEKKQLRTRLASYLERFNYAESNTTVLDTNEPTHTTNNNDRFALTNQAVTSTIAKPKTKRAQRIHAKENVLRSLESMDNRHFEDVLQKFYQLCIEAGDHVVDVGAHKGRHMFPMAEAAGRDGIIYAFEPIPKLFDDLKSVVAQRDLEKNIRLYQLATSHETGSAEFLVVEDEPGLSGLRERTSHDGHEIQKIHVEVDTLDNIIPQTSRISFMKTDAEGADFYILKGATRILEDDRPVIAFECGRINSFPAASYGYQESEFNQFFDSMEYALYDIAGLKYDREFWNKPTLNDLIAIPAESEDYYREMLSMANIMQFSIA